MRHLYHNNSFEAFDSLSIGGHDIPELRYADDTVLLSTTPEGLEKLIIAVKNHSENQNLFLNAKKTKIMKTDKSHANPIIKIGNEEIEVVKEFNYLGTMLAHDGDIRREIKRRCAMALNRLKRMKNLWQGTSKMTRIKIIRTCIFPIAIYGCEAWPISTNTGQGINKFRTKVLQKNPENPLDSKKNE